MNTINNTITNIVKEIAEAYELDEEGIEAMTDLITPHVEELAEELKGSESEEESQTQALLQQLLAQQKQGGEGKTVTRRRASGWNAYASAMRKEHGWGYKEVKENAPWGGLSDVEKEKWNKIAQEGQDKKGGKVTGGSGKVKKANPWTMFMKEYKAGLGEGVKFEMQNCKEAYWKMKAQEGSA